MDKKTPENNIFETESQLQIHRVLGVFFHDTVSLTQTKLTIEEYIAGKIDSSWSGSS
jgi:hypothetical protein